MWLIFLRVLTMLFSNCSVQLEVAYKSCLQILPCSDVPIWDYNNKTFCSCSVCYDYDDLV